jgi:L-aspartate oxidase
MSERGHPVQSLTTDVLIIGAGAAGIRAALAASVEGAEVMMVSEEPITGAGSTFTTLSRGWGIQALVGEERTDRNLETFYEDILRVGLGRCDPVLVRILVEESGSCVEDLLAFGLRFKKEADGQFTRVPGCFSSHPRALITADPLNIKHVFLSMVHRSAAKTLRGQALGIIANEGACRGADILTDQNEPIRISAKATILATGGGAALFHDHLVGEDQVGTGYAMAHRAGAELTNLEFMQFMLGYKKDGMRFFLPLANLDQPGRLINDDGRDVLESRIRDAQGRSTAVRERKIHFPFSCRDRSFWVDLAVDDIRRAGGKVYFTPNHSREKEAEVVHFAHAFNGGIKINERAESTLAGLFAAGETAAGPHGADRIGGCMMTATQVFGKRAGQYAALLAKKEPTPFDGSEHGPIFMKKHAEALKVASGEKSTAEAVANLRHAYSNEMMIGRNARGLNACLNEIDEVTDFINAGIHQADVSSVKAENTLRIMKLTIKSAIQQETSIGPHYRTDAPNASTAS